MKGPLQARPAWLGAALADGVMLLRRIDSFADTHPAFRRSRARVSEVRRRFGGIMVDMFYDHFLAVHWQRFSAEPLVAFTTETYRLINAHDAPLPASTCSPTLVAPAKIPTPSPWPASETPATAGGIGVGQGIALVLERT